MDYIEATTDAEMEELELAIGAAHHLTGLDPIMKPRTFGRFCAGSKDAKYDQKYLDRFHLHVDADEKITREGGVLLVTAQIAALPVGDVAVEGRGVVRLDVAARTRTRAQLSVAGRRLVDDMEARRSAAR